MTPSKEQLRELKEQFMKDNFQLFDHFVPPELDDLHTETENRILNEQAVKRALGRAEHVANFWLSILTKEREELIREVEGMRNKLKGRSHHGNCCTCQDCQNFHDDCTCEKIRVFDEVINIVKKNI